MMRARGLLFSSWLALFPAIATSQPPVPPSQPGRSALEQQLRERTAHVIRRRLDASDKQMEQMEGVNRRFAPQLNELEMQERQARQQLRRQIMLGDSANQPVIGELMTRMLRLQRRRLDVIESEQQELSLFLTPIQRAKYMGLQQQIRHRVEELRRRREGGPQRDGTGPKRRPPPF